MIATATIIFRKYKSHYSEADIFETESHYIPRIGDIVTFGELSGEVRRVRWDFNENKDLDVIYVMIELDNEN